MDRKMKEQMRKSGPWNSELLGLWIKGLLFQKFAYVFSLDEVLICSCFLTINVNSFGRDDGDGYDDNYYTDKNREHSL